MKLNYFFIWAPFGLYFVYFNIYYQEVLGLNGTQVGVITTVAQLLSGISAILIGMLGDKFGKTRLIFSVASLGAMAAALVLGNTQSFLLILLFAGLLSFFINPLPPLLDSTLIRKLGDDAHTYGQYRVWGSIGYIIVATLGVPLIERFGLRAVFPAFVVVLVFFLLSAQRIPDVQIESDAVSPFKGLKRMVRQPAWLLFAGGVFLIWTSVTGYNTFYGITLKMLGGDERLISLSTTAAALAEIPIMLASAPLLRRFGARRFVQVSFVCYVIRMAAYALMPTPGWAPVISLMQIVTFGPFWLGAVAYADELASPGLRATSQGLLATVMSLANMLGAILGGWLLDLTGVSGLYWGLAAIAAAAVLLLWVGNTATRKLSPEIIPIEE